MQNQIIQGDALTKLRELESESIDCCITSPPYWALRCYKTPDVVWDADNGCAHEWTSETVYHDGSRNRNGLGSDSAQMKQGFERANGLHSSDFCSKCNAWKGSLGLEPTFQLYINHLIQIFNEVKRVLKKSGACWVNMGDTYSAVHTGGHKSERSTVGANRPEAQEFRQPKQAGLLPEKSLCLIPERFAIAMVDQGWILRNKIIWFKPNCMPSSAKDRFTVDWEYLYFFVKSPRYYFETQYEPMLWTSEQRYDYTFGGGNKYKTLYESGDRNDWDTPKRLEPKPMPPIGGTNKHEGYGNPTYSGEQREASEYGRIKRCVWKIPTQPFSDAHFAVFPPAIVETPLKATCPEYVCRKCGKPREKQYTEERINTRPGLDVGNGKSGKELDPNAELHTSDLSKYRQQILRHEDSLTDCGCNAGFDGGIVLDCFMGSGTTAIVAMQNARNFVGIELNPEYIKMAMQRLDPYLKQERITAYE
jgi:DNA modification methylase